MREGSVEDGEDAMNITLVFPDQIHLDQLEEWWYPPKEKRQGKAVLPSLGMLYLAAMIQRDHTVSYIDNSVQKLSNDRLVDVILRGNPTVVGFGGTMLEWPQAAETAALLKKARPDLITVYGGPNATARPEKHIHYFDYVFRGMAEFAFSEFLQKLERKQSLAEIPGLCSKSMDTIASPAVVDDLDCLPWPDRTLIDLERYRRKISPLTPPTDVVMTSRGCPFDCRFCSSQFIWGRKYLSRSIEQVVEEIRYMVDRYGSRSIHFREDNLTINKRRLVQLCQAMSKMGLEWTCQSRITSLDYDTVKMMKECGCKLISCGFESINDSTLRYLRKRQTARQIFDIIEIFERVGIFYTGAYIVATPNEGHKEILNTIEFARQVAKFPFSKTPEKVCRFVGIPVSELYYKIIEEGLVEYDWQGGELLFPRTHKMTSKDIDQLIIDAYHDQKVDTTHETQPIADTYRDSKRFCRSSCALPIEVSKKYHMRDVVTVVVRSVGERTEQLCLKLIENHLPANNIHIVHQVPFWKALKETYQIGIRENRKWTLALDADILLYDGALDRLIRFAEKTDEKICCILSEIDDKLLMTRRHGTHLYRTQYLPHCLDYLAHHGRRIRPECETVKEMRKKGYPYLCSNVLLGIHDAEQYYRDIYRKCFVHAQKNMDLVKSAKPYWIANYENNPDFRVALRAVEDAQWYAKQVEIDVKADFLKNVDQILSQMGLAEKPPLSEEQMEMLCKSLPSVSAISSSVFGQLGASEWFDKARHAMSENRWSDAMFQLQKVIELLQDKTPQDIYNALSECWQHLGAFPKATDQQEKTRGNVDKYTFLKRLHQAIKPSLYLEIGVQHGSSLTLASCRAIGIDPVCQIKSPLKPSDLLIKKSSDEFFASEAEALLKQAPDLVFIDGMHWFEFVLRDFINVERFSAPWTVVVIDDIFPVHPDQARRNRITRTWTGDVWKLYHCLKQYRPDLTLLPLDVSPTGLLVIIGMDKNNTILKEKYTALLNQFNLIQDVPADILCRSEAQNPTEQLMEHLSEKVEQLRQQFKTNISAVSEVISVSDSAINYNFGKEKSPKLAVYTAVVGDYDDLMEPLYRSPDCDYICFTDNPHLQSDVWKIKLLPSIQTTSRLKAKMPKLLPHLFLPDYQTSVWVDANIQIRGDVKQLADAVLKEKPMAVFSHPENRMSVYEEAIECIKRFKDDPELIVKQMEWYAAQGLPAKPIPACGILFRRHFEPIVAAAMEQWWLQVNQYSSRDQLSFAYIVEKCQLPLFVISENLRDNSYFKWLPHKRKHTYQSDIRKSNVQQTVQRQLAYKPWGHPVRVWSNQQLRLIAPLIEGAVLNVSGWEDKEGGFYRDYFVNASRYDISNFSHNHPTTGADRMFFLDLTKPLAAELIGQYDAVFCHTTLEHIFDIFTAFRNLCLLTKDILILVVPFIQQQHEKPDYKDYWRFTPSCLRQLLQENGLNSIYEAYSDQPHQVNYLFFVGSKQPQRWTGKMPSYQPLDAVGNWVK